MNQTLNPDGTVSAQFTIAQEKLNTPCPGDPEKPKNPPGIHTWVDFPKTPESLRVIFQCADCGTLVEPE